MVNFPAGHHFIVRLRPYGSLIVNCCPSCRQLFAPLAGAGAGAGEDAEGVCGGTEGVSSNADENPDELILSIIEENSTKKGILRDDFYAVCAERNISREVAEECVNRLVEDGTLYLPKGGYIKIL